MRNILVSLTAAVVTATTLAASTAPANAARRYVAGPGHVAARVYVAPLPVVRAPVVRGAPVVVVPGPVILTPRVGRHL